MIFNMNGMERGFGSLLKLCFSVLSGEQLLLTKPPAAVQFTEKGTSNKDEQLFKFPLYI